MKKMKKMKKLIGLLLAASMLPAMTSVYAEEYNFDVSDEHYALSKDWHIYYDPVVWNKKVDTAKPTKKYARTGKYALHIKNTNTENRTFRVKNCEYRYYNRDAEGNFRYTPGTYKLEYWAKLKQRDYICAPGTTGWAKAYANINEMATNIYDENGWRKYEKTIVLTQEDIDGRGYGTTRNNDYFAIAVTKGCEVVIDDMKLYKVGEESVNLIKDGGFEGSYLAMEEAEGNTFVYPIGLDVRNWDITGEDIRAYIEPTAREKYQGNYSAHLVAGDVDKANFRYADIRFNNLNLKSGKYNISFYAKGRYGRGAIYNNAKNADGLKEFSAMTKGATDENGWIKYSVQTTYTTDNASIVFTILYGTDMYIDNVEILAADDATKAAMGTGNLIKYGGFEEVSTVPVRGTEAIHPMAYTTKDGKGLNISWTNPDNSYIEDIDVYVDGEIVNNGECNLDKSAFSQMLVTGLTPNKEYEIEIVMNVDGDIVTNKFTGIPDEMGAVFSRGGWRYARFSDVEYSNANFSLDTVEKASGNNSLKLDINLPEIIPNCYPCVIQTAKVRRDTPYTFTMKYKTQNVTELPIGVEYIDRDENGDIIHRSWEAFYVGPSNNWKEFTQDISGVKCIMHDNCNFHDLFDTTGKTYDVNIYITAQKGTGSLWVDDVSLKDSYGLEGNLFVNGGFEYTYEIQNPVYKSNNEVIQNVTAGKMAVTAKIKNYAVNNMNAMIVVALYKGNQLVNSVLVEKPINVTPLVIPAEEITQTIEAPADISDGEYKVKVFYWDGASTIKPLDEADILVEAN